MHFALQIMVSHIDHYSGKNDAWQSNLNIFKRDFIFNYLNFFAS